ncbi:MAG: hypothetical protein D6704_00510 [Nitrospirae bacterium]|nr:MAG: hypothetical protein D6704_00510 [Nitrospirota bacterium]
MLQDWWIISTSEGGEELQKGGGRYWKAPPAQSMRCAQCGGDIKIYLSPKRNPHSGKLGRGVQLKDHDLCRWCWRKLVRRSHTLLPSRQAKVA